MKYYRIDRSKRFYRRKYAYLSVNNDNDKEDEEFIRYEKYQCPHCGYKNMWYFYPETFVDFIKKRTFAPQLRLVP